MRQVRPRKCYARGTPVLLCVTVLLCCILRPLPASATSDAQLKGLTPVGAERAGNASGTIPAWTGGLCTAPPGWTPSNGYTSPFADERPQFTITAANVDQYKSLLSPGLLALFKQYPGFQMPVYPSHRTAAYPVAVLQRVVEHAGKARMQDAGIANLETSTIPFPEPKSGLEAISNHLMRYVGGGIERQIDSFSVRANGSAVRIGFQDIRVYDENFDERVENRLFSYLGWFTAPAELVGTTFLVHEPSNQVRESRKAWVYNSGQRRVRRAPELAYDSVQDGSDGLAVVDQYDGYNGAPDRYQWTLKGKREMLVSYNAYGIGGKALTYDRILQKSTVNPDFMRYELHRVWVVEAALREGQSHVYAKRVFYLDEDSWSVLLSEAYDQRGQLWRVGIHGLVQYYDACVPWYRFELWHDLTNGSYVLTGLDNAYKGIWKFGIHGRNANFTPDALRRHGR